MHVVIWTSHGQHYATPSSSVVEVIPIVNSRPVPNSEPWLTGLFDYRGHLLPLIDSSRLLGQGASEIRMSSRILVIRTAKEEKQTGGWVGLIVQYVLGSENMDFEGDANHWPPPLSGFDFLGPVARTPESTVQLMIPERLPMGMN